MNRIRAPPRRRTPVGSETSFAVSRLATSYCVAPGLRLNTRSEREGDSPLANLLPGMAALGLPRGGHLETRETFCEETR